MASLTFTFTGYPLTGFDERFLVAFAEEGRAAMTVATEKILATWQGNSPVDTGAYRASETAEVEQNSSTLITGSVGSPLAYAPVIESGRSAGARMPPPAALELWVRRKFGLTDPKQIRSAAFLVARAISQRGLPAKKPLGRSVEENAAFLSQLFSVDFPAAMARRL